MEKQAWIINRLKEKRTMESHKAKAIEHIDRQIGKFEELLQELTTAEATFRSIEHEKIRRYYDPVSAFYQEAERHLLVMKEKYDDLYDETEFVLRHYISPEDLEKFRNNVVNYKRSRIKDAYIEAAKIEESVEMQKYRDEMQKYRDKYTGPGTAFKPRPEPPISPLRKIEWIREYNQIEDKDYIEASKQNISNLRIYKERIEVFGPFGRDTLHFEGDFIMGDRYNVEQAGAVGPGSHAHDMVFNKITTQSGDTIDLPSLAKELSMLRTKMKEKAVEPEQDVAVGAIAEAETEAKNGNAPKVLESLAKAGKWALDIATQIGTPVAIAAIKASLGMQ